MISPLITSLRQGSGWQARISADWMLQNLRPSAKSAEGPVVGLDYRIKPAPFSLFPPVNFCSSCHEMFSTCDHLYMLSYEHGHPALPRQHRAADRT